MSEIQRYEMEAGWGNHPHGYKMQERPDGEYVLYFDHAAALRERDERIANLEAEKDTALAANELDRRNLNAIVRSIDAEITGRMWLIEGRGSYEWDDDRYKHEFGWTIHAIQEKLDALRRIAGDLSNSPINESGVERVRKLEKLEAENAVLRQQVERLSAPVTDAEWLMLCAGDEVEETDMQRHDIENFLANRKGAA